MRSRAKLVFFFFTLLFFSFVPNVVLGYVGGGGGGGQQEGQKVFVLPKSEQVMWSEAGEFRVVKGFTYMGVRSPMHIGFINMEPKSLFVPQYLDSSLILFIRKGNAKIGWIHNDGLVKENLKVGDVYRIPAGSTFYIVNTGEGQILQMICSIDTSESLGMEPFQSFFIGGGRYPVSILAGFDEITLTTAFNASSEEVREMLTNQGAGPMVFMNSTHDLRKLDSSTQLKHQERLYNIEDREWYQSADEGDLWTWRKLLNFIFIGSNKKESQGTEPYNLYDREPDFENKYGSTRAVTQDDYAPLGHSGERGIGVYLVYLTAGAMLAPHVNPTATEYGVVLSGSGTIEVVFPNGSSAMNKVVNEGDVFWIPKYYPFCQIASRYGPFVFFGFTTSAQENHPQILVGANSILHVMNGPEIAMSFGMNEKNFTKLMKKQNETLILPSAQAAPPREREEQGKGSGREGSVIQLWG